MELSYFLSNAERKRAGEPVSLYFRPNRSHDLTRRPSAQNALLCSSQGLQSLSAANQRIPNRITSLLVGQLEVIATFWLTASRLAVFEIEIRLLTFNSRCVAFTSGHGPFHRLHFPIHAVSLLYWSHQHSPTFAFIPWRRNCQVAWCSRPVPNNSPNEIDLASSAVDVELPQQVRSYIRSEANAKW